MKEKRNIKAHVINTDLLHNIICLLVSSAISECNIVAQEMGNLKYIQGADKSLARSD